MKRILPVCAFILYAITAQSQTAQYSKALSGAGGQVITSSVFDSEGNVYATGWHTGTTDVDPSAGVTNITSVGSRDIFVWKLSATGNLVWVRNFGSTASDEGVMITCSVDGYMYVTGIFSGSVNFDPGVTNTTLVSGGSFDCFVLKLDTQGAFMWAKGMGGSSTEFSNTIVTDQGGNVYVGGTFGGTVDFDPGPGIFNFTSSGGSDIFISKLTSAGNLVWAKTLGGTVAEGLGDMKIDNNNRLYITGTFRGTLDFDVNTGVQNRTANTGFTNDNFIVKWDTASNFIWVNTFGSTGAESSKALAITPNNEVINIGFYSLTVDFNPDPGTAVNLTATGAVDSYILKLDSMGSFVWAKSIGNVNTDNVNTVSTDAYGNIYCAGWFVDTVDFDPNIGVAELISLNAEDAFVLKLDANGDYLWAFQNGGVGFQSVNSLLTRSIDGTLLVGGQFENTVDFDPGIPTNTIVSAGSSDGFLQLISTGSTPIPVKLLWFTGEASAHKTLLKWQTASETNNRGFYVEKSSDGIWYTTIGFSEGKGNAMYTSRYQFEDNKPSTAYYRLRQEDFDGNYTFSESIAIKVNASTTFLSPNPASTQLAIQSTQKILAVELTNIEGVLSRLATSGINHLDISSLQPGTYVVKILLENGETVIHRLIKLE